MKRLRHPVRAIREPFGTAGLVVACVALIAALGGTALAAAKLNSTQKKEVEKIAKKYAGKPGAPGAQGPAGANGKDGSAGAKGATGPQGSPGGKGATGSAGATGEDGKSVEALTIDTGEEACEGQGGAEYTVEGSGEFTQVCSGKEGSPWTVGGTLPPGASETGTWSFQADPAQTEALAPVSFPILLPPPSLKESNVHYSSEENFADFDEAGTEKLGCLGTSSFPKAPPGHLCVYQARLTEENATFSAVRTQNAGTKGANRSGALIEFSVSLKEPSETVIAGSGSFAVSAACAAGEEVVTEEESGEVIGFSCQPTP